MSDLSAQNISKEFPTPNDPLRVLNDVSFDLNRGENLAILGPSGCGKSTLLHILGALDSPTSGSIRLDGEDPFSLNDKDLAAFRNRKIGFIFQDHHLLPQLTAIENVLVPTLADGKASPEEIQRARDLLEQVGLTDRSDHRPAELSGGERQRVAIARALVFQPTLLLADEPTGNLDQSNAQSIGQLLVDLQQVSTPPRIMVVVTHSTELAAMMQRQIVLTNGQLQEAATKS